ncbi:MAG: hypothetical protein U0842_17690 [Candidatus Binatia bacterium]
MFLRSPDTDGDGLPDDWETNGVSFDGVFIDLPAMGADPRHKDIFVHAEWMQPDPARPAASFKPTARALKIVSDAFLKAPITTNPDGKPGVRLHVDAGPDSVMNPLTSRKWGVLSPHRGRPSVPGADRHADGDEGVRLDAVRRDQEQALRAIDAQRGLPLRGLPQHAADGAADTAGPARAVARHHRRRLPGLARPPDLVSADGNGEHGPSRPARSCTSSGTTSACDTAASRIPPSTSRTI